jgi:hypothetical protein
MVRIKAIRTKNTVMVNSKQGAGVLYKIADCARTAFRPCEIDDPRGRFFVRANCNDATTEGVIQVATFICTAY